MVVDGLSTKWKWTRPWSRKCRRRLVMLGLIVRLLGEAHRVIRGYELEDEIEVIKLRFLKWRPTPLRVTHGGRAKRGRATLGVDPQERAGRIGSM